MHIAYDIQLFYESNTLYLDSILNIHKLTLEYLSKTLQTVFK